MSDHFLRFIPTSPEFVPSPFAQKRSLQLLERQLVQADSVGIELSDTIQFIDAGQNFERVSCPHCLTELETPSWGSMMDAAHQYGFRKLDQVMPCCAKRCSLNELNYQGPQGFARFVIEVVNANIPRVAPELLAQLEHLWAHPVRVVDCML